MTVDDLVWFVGDWRGLTGDDAIDETWSPPAGGTLMGMFRWLKGDAVYLYEFLVIKPHASTLAMHIKHFDDDLVGREEKDQTTFLELISAGDNQALFENVKPERRFRLRYQREGDLLTVTTIVIKPDSEQQSAFVYQRVI